MRGIKWIELCHRVELPAGATRPATGLLVMRRRSGCPRHHGLCQESVVLAPRIAPVSGADRPPPITPLDAACRLPACATPRGE